METPQYCVFNQTTESFLSLAVSLGDNKVDRLKELMSRGTLRADEGCWITNPSGWNTMGLFESRDLLYLDDDQQVVDVIESHPRFRVAPSRSNAVSLLALPERTIYASQTQPGNQLVIGVAEEVEFRLRSLPQHASFAAPQPQLEPEVALKTWAPLGLEKDRRSAVRKRWPRLVAYNATGEALVVHGIRDISATGLYLMTDERWPLGSNVKMSLQRTDGLDDSAMAPMTVQLRVCRWGADGVGLEFQHSEAEKTALVAMQAR